MEIVKFSERKNFLQIYSMWMMSVFTNFTGFPSPSVFYAIHMRQKGEKGKFPAVCLS